MAYTSSLHLSKHLLLPRGHRARQSSSRSPSFVPAARVNGAQHVNGHANKAQPNGKVRINGGDGKKGPGSVVNGKTHHVNGHDRIHLSVSTGPGGQDGTGLRVAYQGAPGAYSEFAAKTALPGCDTVPCRAFADALAAVDRGLVDRAILPVESTMEGTALRNYDLLLRHDLVVAQEINLFVHYCLLAMPGVRAAEVRRVISHPMALAHCGGALARLGVDREPVEDTAGAVEMLRSNMMLDTAAIASPRAATSTASTFSRTAPRTSPGTSPASCCSPGRPCRWRSLWTPTPRPAWWSRCRSSRRSLPPRRANHLHVRVQLETASAERVRRPWTTALL